MKGGATAQGYAFHSIVKASKKQLLLTGTIAGGYASHLFYTLYRVHPSRMKAYGFEYTDEKKFVEKYGTTETEYAFNGSEGSYNKNSRGKKLKDTQVKPGISPMIYKDFLLDQSVCLDLSDMSKFLPPYKEKVITCKMNGEIEEEYNSVISTLRSFGSFKNPLLPALMQFSLAYLDKPYGYGKILNPQTGMAAAEPKDFMLSSSELLPKETMLVDLINEELEQGRSIFVFCEFTGGMDKNVTERLKDIITYHCTNKVVILHSDRPSPKEREEWIHKKASQGYRVVICNPKAVETGLNFCFDYNGKHYSYSTLIFYQLGTNLFTLWQASRRAYRLSQKEECRTFYMAYEGTAQSKIIELMALKMKSTMAIQGSFSAEGLASMSKGIDAKMILAESLMKNSNYKSGKSLQDMFDVLNNNENDGKVVKNTARGNYIFNELVGDGFIELEDSEHAMSGNPFDIDDIQNLFDLFSPGPMMSKASSAKTEPIPEKEEEKKEEQKEEKRDKKEEPPQEDDIFSLLEELTYSTVTVKKGKKTIDTGQLTLF